MVKLVNLARYKALNVAMRTRFDLGLGITCDRCHKEFTNKDVDRLYNWSAYYFCSEKCMGEEKHKFKIVVGVMAIIVSFIFILIGIFTYNSIQRWNNIQFILDLLILQILFLIFYRY